MNVTAPELAYQSLGYARLWTAGRGNITGLAGVSMGKCGSAGALAIPPRGPRSMACAWCSG